MKTLTLLLALTFSGFQFAQAQWVSIPDTIFVQYLRQFGGLTSCMQGSNSTGWQMDTTCPGVLALDTIHWPYADFTDVTGVQYFDNLKSLSIYGNELTFLPNLPASLTVLRCGLQHITALPQLPNTLVFLDCGANPITNLVSLPDSLQTLYCGNTSISSLPALPGKLQTLSCGNNPLLTSLPPLPSSLRDLRCRGCQIISIPELPDVFFWLDISDNPINCLPRITYVTQLDFTGTGITCKPNSGSVTRGTPSYAALPFCDVVNENGCDVYWNITGKVYYDANTNCANDSGEAAGNGIKVKLYKGTELVSQTYTNADGNYSFDIDSFGTHTIMIDTSQTHYRTSCPPNGSISLAINAMDSMQYADFGMHCVTNNFNLLTTISDCRFRQGSVGGLALWAGFPPNFEGIYCTTQLAGDVQLVIDGPVSYVSPMLGALTPTTVAGNTITWSNVNFSVTNFRTAFRVMVSTDVSASLGTPVTVAAMIIIPTPDIDTIDNKDTVTKVVIAAFDPNDKAVYPAGIIDSSQEWLTYNVRFQNTGTAEAINIFIEDTLSSYLDYSSFELLSYSHQPIVHIRENAIRFNYPNINLPDSNTNEPESHGFVHYRIRLKDNLPAGTLINNTAFIYFDFNEAVVTNTVTNTICIVQRNNINAHVCTGDTYNFNGNSLSTAGVYTHSMPGTYGCDSIVTLTLTVKDNTSSTIEADITQGSSYNFFGTVLTTAGTYSTVIQNSFGCDSSVTLILNVVSGISQLPESERISISPNPATTQVTITIPESLLNSTATITDITGRRVGAVQLTTTNLQLATENWSSGVYLVTIATPQGSSATKKLVVGR